MIQQISIIGIGMGNPEMLTGQARKAIDESDCLIGAKRMLEAINDFDGERFESINNAEIVSYIQEHPGLQHISILVSGDVGFYSTTSKLTQALEKSLLNCRVEWINGISCLQYFCSKLHTSWENVNVITLHGRDENFTKVLASVERKNKTFVLLGSTYSVAEICESLVERGLGEVYVAIGEDLSYPEESIQEGLVEEFVDEYISGLCVMYFCNNEPREPEYGAIEDSAFIRQLGADGKKTIPMTKSEVRTISVSKLKIEPNNIIYDIGAGTGSVAIEMARQAPEGYVYAIEKNPEAIQILRQNKKKFKVSNLIIVEGEAPECLANLPAPDRAFIGGTTGKMKGIFQVLLEKNPGVRIVLNTITLESLTDALTCFREYSLTETEIIQLTVVKAQQLSDFHMMMGQNPVMVLSGQGGNKLAN